MLVRYVFLLFVFFFHLHSSFRITYVHNYLPTQNVNRLRLQQAIGYLLQCTMHYVPFCLVFVIFFTFFVSRTICVWLCECVASVIAPKRFKRLSAIETLISHSRQVEKLSKSSSKFAYITEKFILFDLRLFRFTFVIVRYRVSSTYWLCV